MSESDDPGPTPDLKNAPKLPSFKYDLDLFNLCQKYIAEKNHHGLALIARQKGLPPFLRFQIFPILLKYHPFVVNPFIQPDSDLLKKSKKEKDEGKESSEVDTDAALSKRIKKDLEKYVQRLKYTSSHKNFGEDSPVVMEIFSILEKAIFKFAKKWGKIIRYDSALTWIALGLAEWVPPINRTPWVLIGRDVSSERNSLIKSIFDDYSNYIENIPDIDPMEFKNDLINDVSNNMKFQDVYERLVLVLLHCPPDSLKNLKSSFNLKLNTEKMLNNLPMNGGLIEERVTLFIYCLRHLLPELSAYFNEEQILNKFGSNDDEWIIWWLKYFGSKVWSRIDRGRIWDLTLGFKQRSENKPPNYYFSKLGISASMLHKLGTDTFWSINSFEGIPDDFQPGSTSTFTVNTSSDSSPTSSEPSSLLNGLSLDEDYDSLIPFSQIDPTIQLIFITLAILKCKENVLIELDQHEIRQYLSRLPTNSYSISNKYQIFKQKIDRKREESSGSQTQPLESDLMEFQKVQSPSYSSSSFSVSPVDTPSTTTSNTNSNTPTSSDKIISNDSFNNHSIDFMDNIINEGGELWRKWLFLESGNT